MALGTTNISMTLVKGTLGETTLDLGSLCTSAGINMWSRYKPVRGTFPQGDGSTYGLSMPVLTGSSYSPTGWQYVRPDSVFRLGDFRGYEPSALMPPVYSKATTNATPSILSPSGRFTTARFTVFGNSTNSTTRIRPSDIGIDGYYIGLRYRVNNGFWYYKTAAQVSTLTESVGTPLAVDVQVTVNGGIPSFADAPVTTIGTAYWELVLCSTQCSNWTSSQPSTVIILPATTIDGVVLESSGSFTVDDWIVITDNNMTWGNSDTSYQSTYVYTSYASWSLISKPTWIYANVYRNGNLISGGGYENGDELRLQPSGVNSGSNRSGSVEVTGNTVSVYQYGHNPALLGTTATGLVVDSVSVTLSVGATSAYTTFHTVSGIGSTDVTVWVRLWSVTAVKYLGSWQTVATHDNQTEYLTLTGFSSTDIGYGSDYQLYITTSDPTK